MTQNTGKAKIHGFTRAGRKQLDKATSNWTQTTAILERFLNPSEDAI